MKSKKIYGIKTTTFDENGEIKVSFLNIGLFTTLKKAYEDMQITARVFDATIYDENTPDMRIHYTSEQGERVMETIETHFLY